MWGRLLTCARLSTALFFRPNELRRALLESKGPASRDHTGRNLPLFGADTACHCLISHPLSFNTLAASSKPLVPRSAVVRQNVRIEHRARVTPVAGAETLFDQHGLYSQRLIGGLRFRVGRHARPEFQYHYDTRRAEAGGNRQEITTTIRLDNPKAWF